jgi:hypothetical protein
VIAQCTLHSAHPDFIDGLEAALEFEACAVRVVRRFGGAQLFEQRSIQHERPKKLLAIQGWIGRRNFSQHLQVTARPGVGVRLHYFEILFESRERFREALGVP